MKRTIEEQYKAAMALAIQYHEGQVDIAGEPYIEHLMTVSNKVFNCLYSKNGTVEEADFSMKAQIVALLHDILEDTDCTEEVLAQNEIDEEIITAVKAMTHQLSMPYFEYIQEVEKNPLARAVKLCDLEHNLDVRRLKRISDSDLRRIRKYWAAWKYLKKEISAEKAQNMIEKKEG